MDAIDRFTKFFAEQNVPFEVLHHKQVYTAQEVAQVVHRPGNEIAKTVIANVDGSYMMIVVPAPHRVNLASLKETLKAQNVRLASEHEVQQLFPDCELGAMPPLGNLYNLPVLVSKSLTEDTEIVFNAGTHSDAIKISFSDFQRLAHPVIAEVSDIPRL